jgi:Asp-tRNA(Asn)/Glu-tRNA(Gln) amidotransferase A subunit family amidase
MIEVTEVSIAQLRAALESGQTTAVELVQAYLARIDAYDGTDTPTALNAVVVRNPEALAEAQASDARRAKGQTLGPLDGIPYTAKDSYLVKGLTAASGSPAFKDLIAYRDAFTIERLRGAGAICLGKTNMPPMANGGMQRASMAVPRARTTPTTSPRLSPPARRTAPARPPLPASPPSAWPKKPGRAAVARRRTTVCAPIRLHAG